MNHRGLFDRVKIGRTLELKNRIVLAPLYYDWSFGSRAFNRFFETRAKGGVSLALVPVPTHGGLGDLSDDVFVEQSRQFLEIMHGLNCAVVPQIFSGVGEEVNNFSTEALEVLPDEFARAARVLQDIGYDGVEIHGAHHSLFMSLISPQINRRQDQYGGSEPGRFSLPTDTVASMKRAAPDFPVFYRFSAVDFVYEGFDIASAVSFAATIESAGVDCIDVSAGGTIISPQYSDAPGEEYGEGCFVKYAAAIKMAVKVPVIVAGRINNRRTAEAAIGGNSADLVAMGRTLVKNPAWPRQLATKTVEEAL